MERREGRGWGVGCHGENNKLISDENKTEMSSIAFGSRGTHPDRGINCLSSTSCNFIIKYATCDMLLSTGSRSDQASISLAERGCCENSIVFVWHSTVKKNAICLGD